ncbi:MAG: sulfur transferase domain-containing protein [Pyrinomonadaceae bacterium]
MRMVNKTKIGFLGLGMVLILALSITSQTPENSKNLPNFHKVNGQLYRGGQPKDAGFAELKRQGFVTVISLRDDDERARREKELAEAAGLRFINVPLANWSRPSVKDIEAIEAAIDLPENQPVFVHCRRGADRTGTVMAVYRMRHDGWNAKQASEEAEKFGIGWWQFPMRDFIHDYYRDMQNKTQHD